jgi:hypothetical protein
MLKEAKRFIKILIKKLRMEFMLNILYKVLLLLI